MYPNQISGGYAVSGWAVFRILRGGETVRRPPLRPCQYAAGLFTIASGGNRGALGMRDHFIRQAPAQLHSSNPHILVVTNRALPRLAFIHPCAGGVNFSVSIVPPACVRAEKGPSELMLRPREA